MTTPTIKRNPWSWIPTLYFAEGLPYVAVMTIAVIMYKRLGLSWLLLCTIALSSPIPIPMSNVPDSQQVSY